MSSLSFFRFFSAGRPRLDLKCVSGFTADDGSSPLCWVECEKKDVQSMFEIFSVTAHQR